jgi:hypothetical protein
MSKAKVLIQLDTDAHASVFDALVAIDAGVDQLLPYRGVTPDDVRDLVHGAMFTRGPEDLKNTAIFVGGSDVTAAEEVFRKATECFFGPLRVSTMLDANGANTTAVAAVLAAARHIALRDATVLVLAATGPVGQRAVRLLVREGARVRVASRRRDRAEAVCARTRELVGDAAVEPWETAAAAATAEALAGVQVVIAAGAAGVELLPADVRSGSKHLQVAIDLNAVPPLGIAGVEATDRAAERDGVICYGAIGVGRTKMKIHGTAIARLFQSNDLRLDAEEIYALGRELEA